MFVPGLGELLHLVQMPLYPWQTNEKNASKSKLRKAWTDSPSGPVTEKSIMNKLSVALRSSVSLAALASCIVIASQTYAEDFVASSAYDETNEFDEGFATIDGNDTFTVQAPDGSLWIDAGGGDAIFAFGPNNTIIIEDSGSNPGDPTAIRVLQAGAAGIRMNGDNATVINDGRIDTSTNDNQFGIRIVGNDANVQSTGLVFIFTDQSTGISVNGLNALIQSDGGIVVQGANATGISLIGDDGRIINDVQGRIDISPGLLRAGLTGIFAQGNRNTVQNSGTIDLVGDDNVGIFLDGDDGLVLNETASPDRISVDGVDSFGIRVSGERNNVRNRGSIIADGDSSSGIRIAGADNRVDLELGSVEVRGLNGNGVVGGLTSDNLIVTIAGGSVASIRLVGDMNTGIAASGQNTTIDVAGLILGEASATNARGIQVTGDNATVNNSGNIRVRAEDSFGVEITGGGGGAINSTINNTGSIRADSAGSRAIRLLNGGHTINNSGLIGVAGAGSFGILTESGGIGNNVIVNSGTIEFQEGLDPASAAIVVRSDASDVLNSGEIRASGGGDGIIIEGDNVFVRNSGRIFAAGGGAFDSSGADTILRLDAGSILVGDIDLAGPNSTLDVRLPNTALAFNGPPTNIESEGRPYYTIGGVLFVVDADHFAKLDQITFAQLDQIDFSLAQRRATASDAAGRSFWVNGNIGIEGETDTFAGIVGATHPITSDRYLSVFTGASASSYETDFSSSQIDATTNYAGVTWGGTFGSSFFETALSLGVTASETTRRVANNMVSNGIEDAAASTDSRFVGLSGVIGTQTVWQDVVIRPSLRVRYGWQQFDAFEETGSSANLSVEERTSQQVDIRAKVETDLAPRQTGFGPLSTTIYGGLDVRYDMSDDVVATLAGDQIDFALAEDEAIFGGFVGTHAKFDLSNNASFGLSGEFAFEGRDSTTFNLAAIYQMQF